jgi:hypothetical protein
MLAGTGKIMVVGGDGGGRTEKAAGTTAEAQRLWDRNGWWGQATRRGTTTEVWANNGWWGQATTNGDR